MQWFVNNTIICLFFSFFEAKNRVFLGHQQKPVFNVDESMSVEAHEKPVVEVPLRGTFRKIQQGPSCEPLWGSCMVLRLKSGLRPARHLRRPISQPNTGFCRCPVFLENIVTFLAFFR